jgi:hypothetical protein
VVTQQLESTWPMSGNVPRLQRGPMAVGRALELRAPCMRQCSGCPSKGDVPVPRAVADRTNSRGRYATTDRLVKPPRAQADNEMRV